MQPYKGILPEVHQAILLNIHWEFLAQQNHYLKNQENVLAEEYV